MFDGEIFKHRPNNTAPLIPHFLTSYLFFRALQLQEYRTTIMDHSDSDSATLTARHDAIDARIAHMAVNATTREGDALLDLCRDAVCRIRSVFQAIDVNIFQIDLNEALGHEPRSFLLWAFINAINQVTDEGSDDMMNLDWSELLPEALGTLGKISMFHIISINAK